MNPQDMQLTLYCNTWTCHCLNWLKAACLLIGFFFLSPPLYAAQPSIKLLVSSEDFYLGDSVVIELEATAIDGDIDISPLFRQADLLRETRGTRIAVIEGQVVEVRLRRMEFLPRNTGRVLFGPLTGDSVKGPVRSNTLVLDVKPAPVNDWQPSSDDLQITTRLRPGFINEAYRQADSSSQDLFVGQHLILDIELRHRHLIADETIELPDFKDFDVLEHFKERRTLDVHDPDDPWRLIAWRYHLFPLKTGVLQLSAVKWEGTAIQSRTQRGTFQRQAGALSLQINGPIENGWWLPASQVELTDNWSVDPRSLKAGDEFIRTITLSVEGALASHLPAIMPYESRSISSTLIDQSREQKIQEDRVFSKATFTFRMVAQSPVPVFMDTVRVPWYDIADQLTREALIPARRINIGLPDRADLLSDLAVDDNSVQKWLLKLQATTAWRSLWHISLTALLLTAVTLLARDLVLWRRGRLRARRATKLSVLPDI